MLNEKLKMGFSISNDYKENFYFNSDLFEIIKINTSVDLIRLSISTPDISLLDNEMKKYYQATSDTRLDKGNFRRIKRYIHGTHKIDLLYKPLSDKTFMSNRSIVALHQPDKFIIHQIDSVFQRLSICPVISKLELAFDFSGPRIFELYEFLKRHVFLRYQRSPSFIFTLGSFNDYGDDVAFYTNNLRKSSKGIRIYLRPKDTNIIKRVRVELELHRPIIKRLNIQFPLTANQLDFDFRNYFDFRRIDLDKLYKFLVKENRKHITMPKRKNDTGSIMLEYIQSYVSTFSYIPLMMSVEILKSKDHGVKNYNRFLLPLNALNLLVEDTINKQRFGLL